MKNKTSNIMQVNLKLLRFHGLWPTCPDGKNDQFYRLKTFLVFCALFLLWFGATSHLVNIIVAKKQNVDTELLEDVAISLSILGIFYVFFLFLYKQQDIAHLLQELQNYGAFGKPADAESVNKSFNFYTKLYYVYCVVGGSLFFIFNQTIEAQHCRDKNEEFNRNEVCGFFTHIWLPFDINYTPAYEIMAALQYCASVYGAPVFSIFFIVVVMLQHLICKIRHLKQMAEDVFNGQDLYIQKQKLITCIRYHQYIIRLSDMFNECFGQIAFLYITLGAGVLSITCYQSLKKIAIGPILHLCIWLLSITFVCAAGQQLIDESESVALTFYNLQWTDSSKEIQLMLKLIIMRAQIPLTLKALSFGEMSLDTFMTIMKTAYQYLTLMLQMVESE